MKKLFALMLCLALVLSCAAGLAESDKDAVVAKGKLVVGITDFAPMDYRDTDGSWVGFDADVARTFAATLGVQAEFVEIDWDNKVLELNSGNIDCVWNGMTLTDEVLAAMNCSNPYANNAQIVIVPAEKAADYQTVESLAGLTFAVEAGSAGEAAAKELGNKYNPVQNQAATLLEVTAQTSDAAIIDSLMAAAMVGEGTDYASLTYTVPLTEEKYGVGFRKDSDLADALNDFFKTAWANGTLVEFAKLYGVQAAIIPQE
ncbi:MAG: transporter substrate-binding domain-containing protein [Clostridia bacterium]